MARYNEIHRLRGMLDLTKIPYFIHPLFNGYQICYPNSEEITCSIIEHDYSYGSKEDLLEIMGLLTEEEEVHDSVVGRLSAEEVFERISTDWKGRKGE